MEHALGVKCDWETMVRHPMVYHVDMYRKFRTHIEDLQKAIFYINDEINRVQGVYDGTQEKGYL